MVQKKLQKLPIGIQSFEKLRKKNYLYVDKTKDIYELATTGEAYFLSRPRRFGKSLLCSTLEALFNNKKECFGGTWIATSDWEWKQYPIISLSFARIKHATPKALTENIKTQLDTIAKKYKLKLKQATPGKMLDDLIVLLAEKFGENSVVMLVDEYDKPLINNLNDPKEVDAYRKVLKEFYSSLKDLDNEMQFLFITGVSKFSMVSIFSDLNHLESLSLSPNVATICGYTQTELEHNFTDYLIKAEQKFGYSREHLLSEIKRWYNGYCFTQPEDAPERVYNPFSILNFFKTLQFRNYWFTTGTPSFALEYFKNHDFEITDFEQVNSFDTDLEALDPKSLDLTTVLYQTGYLTIKSWEENIDNANIMLGFPNQEVARSCAEGLMKFITGKSSSYVRKFAIELGKLFTNDNVTTETLMAALIKLCTQIPSPVAPELERGYQFLFWLALELTGINVFVEDPTAEGRIDITIIVGNKAYVIELKIRDSATEALAQIDNKHYAEKYLAQGKNVIKIGILFNIDAKTVTEISLLEAGMTKPSLLINPVKITIPKRKNALKKKSVR